MGGVTGATGEFVPTVLKIDSGIVVSSLAIATLVGWNTEEFVVLGVPPVATLMMTSAATMTVPIIANSFLSSRYVKIDTTSSAGPRADGAARGDRATREFHQHRARRASSAWSVHFEPEVSPTMGASLVPGSLPRCSFLM